ncbi:hypothetical protein FOIG_09409 [Fusarium odoratissimum NRRL 54006]|uniref:Uncharacterized protein n=1 Tax=Fusarium odoratissimum (strain NRRL 54006) TaxID=1089451 RepID=X0KPD1_FUSO5|nr:uncharacterized protein FOIG_09409 [Fusarium odoratissimum NRRL 54006]EXL98664.1 hypothetical protein FOIG_09409 [Fusarium odoratissimum NRRL 54006]
MEAGQFLKRWKRAKYSDSHMSSLRFRDQQGYNDTAIAISVQAKTEEKKALLSPSHGKNLT